MCYEFSPFLAQMRDMISDLGWWLHGDSLTAIPFFVLKGTLW